jgi:hypothetical protein
MQQERSRWRGEIAGVVAPAAQIRLIATRPRAEGVLEVCVEDLDGRKVHGAPVTLRTQVESKTGETDARGIARFEGLVDEALFVFADPPAHLSERLTASPRVEVRPSKELVTLKLRELEKIEGLVLQASGSPAANVPLVLLVDEVRSVAAVTDSNGRYAFRAPRGTSYRIVAQQRREGGAVIEVPSEPFSSGTAPPPLQLMP